MDEKQFQQLIRRLDAISRILVLALPKEMGQAKLIQMLSESGMDPKDIASVIGTNNNVVSATLGRLKKQKLRKKGK